jgi:hypothetical protein
MRCLRAKENASFALGRRGAPPGDTRTPRQELADGVSLRDLAESAARAGRHRGGAPRGEHPSQRVRAARRRVRRHAALHRPRILRGGGDSPGPLCEVQGNTGEPGAHQTTRVAELCLPAEAEAKAGLFDKWIGDRRTASAAFNALIGPSPCRSSQAA